MKAPIAFIAALALVALMLGGSARAQTTQPRPDADTPQTATGAPANGEDLPAAVAEEQITVSSDYRGSTITLFGVNPDRRGRGDIVVVVRGPDVPATVMRKRPLLGLWVNGEPVRFSKAPAFFAVLSNRPLRAIASPQEIYTRRLDPSASIVLASATPGEDDPSAYREALVRLRRAQGLYSDVVANVENQRHRLTVYQGGLFRAVVSLPANAPIAEYSADTYLYRNGHLISSARVPIRITRVGVERQIHDLATNASFAYGLLTVVVAMGAGWLAAFTFRRG